MMTRGSAELSYQSMTNPMSADNIPGQMI